MLVTMYLYAIKKHCKLYTFIWFEDTAAFGKHNDIYFGNLEGHGSPNPFKMKLYISGFGKKWCTGCPKKISDNEMSGILT